MTRYGTPADPPPPPPRPAVPVAIYDGRGRREEFIVRYRDGVGNWIMKGTYPTLREAKRVARTMARHRGCYAEVSARVL